MPPSEASILTNFLLSPASMPTIISLQKFTELFPKRLQSHPQIRTLYRELQELRSQDMDIVSENIMNEIRAGEQQKADLLDAAKASGVHGFGKNENREIELDIEYFGQGQTTPAQEHHSFPSLVEEMEKSCVALEQEIAAAEEEASSTMAAVKQIVGDLSDLRYGKLNKPGLTPDEYAGEVIRGLRGLRDTCDRANTVDS